MTSSSVRGQAFAYPDVKWVPWPSLGRNRHKNDVYQMPDGVAPLVEAWAPLLTPPNLQSLLSEPPGPPLPPLLAGEEAGEGQVSSGASTEQRGGRCAGSVQESGLAGRGWGGKPRGDGPQLPREEPLKGVGPLERRMPSRGIVSRWGAWMGAGGRPAAGGDRERGWGVGQRRVESSPANGREF